MNSGFCQINCRVFFLSFESLDLLGFLFFAFLIKLLDHPLKTVYLLNHDLKQGNFLLGLHGG